MVSKESCPEKAIQFFAQKLKVCGHPIRLKLLCLINISEDPCVTNLWTCLGQSQPVISQHLAILKKQGIVESTVLGNKRQYAICDPFIKSMISQMDFDSISENGKTAP